MLDQEIIYVQFVQQNEWYCFHLKVNCIALHCIPIELHFIVLCSLALAILSFWSGWGETKPSYYYFGKSNSSREISVYIYHHSISIRYRSKQWIMSSVIWIVKNFAERILLTKTTENSICQLQFSLKRKVGKTPGRAVEQEMLRKLLRGNAGVRRANWFAFMSSTNINKTSKYTKNGNSC